MARSPWAPSAPRQRHCLLPRWQQRGERRASIPAAIWHIAANDCNPHARRPRATRPAWPRQRRRFLLLRACGGRCPPPQGRLVWRGKGQQETCAVERLSRVGKRGGAGRGCGAEVGVVRGTGCSTGTGCALHRWAAAWRWEPAAVAPACPAPAWWGWRGAVTAILRGCPSRARHVVWRWACAAGRL